MAKIPIHNKYPNLAGYMTLNTETNDLEIMSDGKFKTIGKPELLDGGNFTWLNDTNPIIITVGVGKDFEKLEDAIWSVYKANISKWTKYNDTTNNYFSYGLKNVKIIISTGYIFDKSLNFNHMFLPNLEITQEDINIPLLVRCATPIYFDYYSSIKKINLNLEGDATWGLPAAGVYLSHNSHIQEINLIAKHFQYAIIVSYSSTVNKIDVDATELERSALLLMYNCYALINSANISDVGITLPYSSGNGLWINQSHLRIYYGQNVNIDNVVQGLRIMEGGIVTISEGTMNISNADNGLYFAFNGGTVRMGPASIIYTNVTNNIYPTTITPNTWNKDGIVID